MDEENIMQEITNEEKVENKKSIIGKTVRIKETCRNWRDKNKTKMVNRMSNLLLKVADTKGSLIYLEGISLPLKKEDLEFYK